MMRMGCDGQVWAWEAEGSANVLAAVTTPSSERNHFFMVRLL